MITRRNLLGRSLGLAALAVGGNAVAKVCDEPTADQPLGPFFPRPGTPFDPVRENPDLNTPIYLANDNRLEYIKGNRDFAIGQRFRVDGVVRDRDCNPIKDATIIIWQASASGRYNHLGDSQNLDFKHPKTDEVIKRDHDPNFQYWGRAISDRSGSYNFTSVVPGFYPANLNGGWYRPPHVHMMVMATGHQQFVTQMYFRGEGIRENEFIQELNDKDSLLQNSDMTDDQREELIVDFSEGENGILHGNFDLTLR